MAQATFTYTALDAAGAKKSGLVEADTREAAVSRLANEGRFVLEIGETKASVNDAAAGSAESIFDSRGPSKQDLALFTRRLADLSGAGLPLDRVLQVVGEQSDNKVLSRICLDALSDVRGGSPVSQALAKYPKYFNDVFTQTLRAGEASGQFSEVAARLAEYQEIEVTRRGQITSALVYPTVLAVAATGMVIFLIVFVIPKMKSVFDGLGNELPWNTRFLMDLATFVTNDWAAIIVVLAATIIGVWAFFRTPAGAESRDRMMLKLPLVGKVIMRSTISRFARVLGTLIYGGVPILEALEISGLSASNKVFLKSARAVEEEVRAGRPIAEAMRDAGEFPPVLVQMVAVGEETGDLPKMLGRVADSMDFEVDVAMRRLLALAEPIILLFMGSVVGFVVTSVMLPIYQAQSLVH